MKLISTTLCVLICVTIVPVRAQITINAYPAPLGSGSLVQYNTDNESGSNTVAIEALIAASGANQVWDMTGITFETEITGIYGVTEGAEGPGADTSPLDQATLTFAVPFEGEDEDTEYEGVVYEYIRQTSDAAYSMGIFFEGEINGNLATFVTKNVPDGDKQFVFPLMMGSSWSSAFTQEGIIDASITKTYEVDGWGTAALPGAEAPVDVLRVKETTTQSLVGVEFTSICYDLWSNDAIGATFCEGEFSSPPTATATVLGAPVTDASSAPDAAGLHFEVVYPNPVRTHAVLNYAVPESGLVTITVYDVLGRPVQNVVSEVLPTGEHEVSITMRDVTPGLYIVRLQAGGAQQSRTFTVVR